MFILLFVAIALVIAIGTTMLIVQLRYPFRKTYAYALAHNWPTSPKELGFDFTEHQLVLPDQTTSEYWRVTGEAKNDLTIILLHGFSDSRYRMLPWLKYLTPHAQTIIMVDLRGHGDASRSKSCFGAKEIDDLKVLLKQLDLAKPCVVFGHSMGAALAIMFAAEVGDQVQGVIADSSYRFFMHAVKEVLYEKRFPAYPFIWLADWHMRFWVSGFSRLDVLQYVKKLKAPLLILHAINDPVAHFEKAKELEANSSEVTFVAIDTHAHCEIFTGHESQYMQAVSTFFAQI